LYSQQGWEALNWQIENFYPPKFAKGGYNSSINGGGKKCMLSVESGWYLGIFYGKPIMQIFSFRLGNKRN
jgi:hypothetical protein